MQPASEIRRYEMHPQDVPFCGQNGTIKEEASMTDARELLSEEMIQPIEDCAKEQGRKPVEVLEEAVGRYIAQRRLDRLAERGERLAQRRNIKEEDIPELVQQVRRENGVRRAIGDPGPPPTPISSSLR
jgi:hypothetical protein